MADKEARELHEISRALHGIDRTLKHILIVLEEISYNTKPPKTNEEETND